MRTLQYEERQIFSPWVYVLVPVAGVGATVGPLLSGQSGLWWVVLLDAVIFPVVLNIFCMITRVYNDEVYVRFGLLFPVMWRHLRLADMRDSRCVQYRPLRDAGGWGYRCGRFEGRRTAFYNARGNRGVHLETSRKPCIIGSQDPERLQFAISEACRRLLA